MTNGFSAALVFSLVRLRLLLFIDVVDPSRRTLLRPDPPTPPLLPLHAELGGRVDGEDPLFDGTDSGPLEVEEAEEALPAGDSGAALSFRLLDVGDVEAGVEVN